MSRGVLCVVLLALILTLPASVAAQDAKVTKAMDAGQSAYEKGRYSDAFDKFKQALEASGGDNLAAVLGQLEALLAMGRYDVIITQISGAKVDDPAQQAQIDALVGRAHLLSS